MDIGTYIDLFIRALISLLVLSNPIGAIPIFLSITDGDTKAERKKTVTMAAFSIGLVGILSALAGNYIMSFFGITIPALRVAGGFLLLLMGINMMMAKAGEFRTSKEERREATQKENVGIVPLAIPVMAGPGFISTTIIYAEDAHTFLGHIMIVIVSVVIASIIWVLLRLSDNIERILGKTGIGVSTRLMGLVLTALAIQLFASGLNSLIHI